jgi:hypothetical protein
MLVSRYEFFLRLVMFQVHTAAIINITVFYDVA